MPKIYTIFEDVAGKLSMMRACLAIVVLVVMFNWSYVNFTKKEILPLPDNTVTLIASLAGAKAIQRFGEKGTTEISIEPSGTTSTSGSISFTSPMTMTVPMQGSISVK